MSSPEFKKPQPPAVGVGRSRGGHPMSAAAGVSSATAGNFKEPSVNHTVRLALDRSVRSYDSDGRLRVATAVLTRACVSPYLGAEVPNYQALGLSASRVYQLLRPEQELRAALAGFNGLPILTRHVPVSADDYRGDLVVGSTGSSAILVNGEVTNSLMIWASPGIDLIESGAARSLSCGYAYTPVMQSGSFQGRPYQILMTDIKPNHLALVAEPRVAGAMVGDAMPRSKFRRSITMRACNPVGFITPPMRLPRRRSQGGSRDSDDGRRPRAYRSAPLFARRGRAAPSPCSSASAASCSCVWR